MKRQVDAIQWGGGSSIIFLWSPEADAIQWGGVVAGLASNSRRDSVGGGSTMNVPLMGPFYIFRLSPTQIICML